ncbi:MAG TPA: GNAT family N-acetyltransferase, partial [Stellaceae bacterium]|nr:GNAT family N-acetyltransferase [Stellaceae bacterium]
RPATRADLPGIFAIRDGAGDERLSNPHSVTEALAQRRIDAGALWVWQEETQPVAGFAAVATATGTIEALLVAPGQEGRGIGRALLKVACDVLRHAGHRTATLRIEAGIPAERHYRAAGWTDAGCSAKGELIFKKVL